MYLGLLVGGVIATAAGVVMLGFGISNNEFGLGNTLLITGTTAVVGGLILIGLAAAIKQLRRIAEALVARPAPRAARPLDPFDPLAPGSSRAGSGPGRIPFPPKPNPEGRGRGPAPMEPRLTAAPPIDAAQDPAFDRPRSVFPTMATTPESHAAPESEEPPMFPRAPRPLSAEPRFNLSDLAVETRGLDVASDFTVSPAKEVLPVSRLDAALRPAAPDTAGQNELFESLWPADAKPSKAPIPKVDPKPEMAEPAPAAEEASAGKEELKDADEPQAVSILKSGVIDEMAYTLYSDGSIEAELPQGTMRFGSITELRGYLEKNS
jgi:hypothetical protein